MNSMLLPSVDYCFCRSVIRTGMNGYRMAMARTKINVVLKNVFTLLLLFPLSSCYLFLYSQSI